MSARLEFVIFAFTVGLVGCAIKIVLELTGPWKGKSVIWSLYAIAVFMCSFFLEWGPLALLKPEISTEPRSLEHIFDDTPVIVQINSRFPVYYAVETKNVATSDELQYTGPIEIFESTRITAFAKLGPFQSPESTVLVRIETSEEEHVPVEALRLEPGELSLTVGQSGQLQAKVFPENAADPKIEWTSSVPSVAAVKDGCVTAVAAGTAEIIARTAMGEAEAVCHITVKGAVRPPQAEPTLEAIELSRQWVALEVGDSCNLTAMPVPVNASLEGVTWSSTNEEVACYHDGRIWTYMPGCASVIAECQGITTGVYVEVFQPEPEPVEIWSAQETLFLEVGENNLLSVRWSGDMEWEALPIRWTVDDPEIAKVSPDGAVYGISEGICLAKLELLGADTEYEVTDPYCEIIVTKPTWEDEIQVWWPDGDLELGESYYPEVYGAEGCDIWFESDDQDIIWVDSETGEMIPGSYGETTVTVWIDGCGYRSEFSVW